MLSSGPQSAYLGGRCLIQLMLANACRLACIAASRLAKCNFLCCLPCYTGTRAMRFGDTTLTPSPHCFIFLTSIFVGKWRRGKNNLIHYTFDVSLWCRVPTATSKPGNPRNFTNGGHPLVDIQVTEWVNVKNKISDGDKMVMWTRPSHWQSLAWF